MALYIDMKYVNLLSMHLDKFTKVDTNLWNFRCPICGDSAKNKSKKRGYIYTKSQAMYYSCKNCDFGTTLYGLIKQVNPSLAAEYNRECYIEKNSTTKPEHDVEEELPEISTKACRLNGVTVKKPFDGKLTRLDELPEDHEAIVYCNNRQIPKSQFRKLFYIKNISTITELPGFRKYEDRVKGKESRIVIPYYNIDGKMTGVTCRAIGNSNLRYISLKLVEDESLIFGVSGIDHSKPIYVTEGAFDSLFVDNCIAVGGTGMGKLNTLGIDKSKLIIVFDNQPRNPEVVGIIERTIQKGYFVVIWGTEVKKKDINDMHLAGENYIDQLKNRVYNGLMARVQFNQWRKV